MEHDAWFFVGVFAFIFIIWLAIGGPTRPLSFAGPTLALPDQLDGGTYLSFPRAPFQIGGASISLPGSSGANGAPTRSGTPIPLLPGGTAFGTPSPYRSTINLTHYIFRPGSDDESIQISISSDTPVDLTGWTLVSDVSGARATIGKGSEIPTSGIVNEAEDIVLAPGTTAIIETGTSPIGASFRENKCIGYFSSFQTFSPALPRTCPVPADELEDRYGSDYVRDPSCAEFVKTIPRCQPTLTPPPRLSGNCQSVLVKYLNYNGCVEAHRNDGDFLGSTWRVYLGRTTPLWRTKNELVKLLDQNGKTVDAFSY